MSKEKNREIARAVPTPDTALFDIVIFQCLRLFLYDEVEIFMLVAATYDEHIHAACKFAIQSK